MYRLRWGHDGLYHPFIFDSQFLSALWPVIIFGYVPKNRDPVNADHLILSSRHWPPKRIPKSCRHPDQLSWPESGPLSGIGRTDRERIAAILRGTRGTITGEIRCMFMVEISIDSQNTVFR